MLPPPPPLPSPLETANPDEVRRNAPAPPALSLSMSLRVSRTLSSRSILLPPIRPARDDAAGERRRRETVRGAGDHRGLCQQFRRRARTDVTRICVTSRPAGGGARLSSVTSLRSRLRCHGPQLAPCRFRQ